MGKEVFKILLHIYGIHISMLNGVTYLKEIINLKNI